MEELAQRAAPLMLSQLLLLGAAWGAETRCQATCEAAGHCSTGLSSCDQLPSCSMGCQIGALPGVSLAECVVECAALSKPGCTGTFQNLSFSMCAACPHWGPGQKPPPNDPTPLDCGKPTATACVEGCNYSHGAPPDPLPPPCVPGSFCCPGTDPAFDTTKVAFAGTFGDNMVLQRAPASAGVYGTATPGAHVTLTLKSADGSYSWQSGSVEVTAIGGGEHRGTWKVLLPPRQTGGVYSVTVACGDCIDATAVATISGVEFGEVWVCSGQSNMEAMVDATFGRNESYAEADAGKYSQIRLWQTPWRPRTNATYILPPMGQGGRPQTINWLSPSNTSLQDFSAVCWYYGKSLADQPALAGVPIGLMGTFVGGTFIEQWIRQEKQGACTETLCGTKDLDGFKCGTLYNGQIAPVVNTTIAGVVWYQGENNVRNVAGSIANRTGYACQMASMIEDWRSIWSAVPNTTDPQFPFGVTQLAGSCSEGFPQNSGAFRRSQTGGYDRLPNPAMPNTFLGQAFDLGDPWQHGCFQTKACFGWNTPFSANRTRNYENSAIHPRPKEPLGGRLARAAMAVHYTPDTQPLILPVLVGCAATGRWDAGGHRSNPVAIRLSFGGVGPLGLAEPKYPTEWVGSSAMELEVDGNWTFTDAVGLSISRSGPSSLDVQLPPSGVVTGIRYGWGDNPCCGSNNRTLVPCPPMSCPLMTADALPEPVVPFLAQVVMAGGTLSCSCDPPMSCDV